MHLQIDDDDPPCTCKLMATILLQQGQYLLPKCGQLCRFMLDLLEVAYFSCIDRRSEFAKRTLPFDNDLERG
jgi:hypothetical protein